MPPRAIELRLDGSNQPRLPLLLVDPADADVARSMAAALHGRVQVVVAARDAGAWALGDGPGGRRELPESCWERFSGWAARMTPSEPQALAAQDVAAWHAPRVLVHFEDEDGTPHQTVYALPLADRAEVRIGRTSESDIAVPDGSLARTQLLIRIRENEYVIRDARPTGAEGPPARLIVGGEERPIEDTPVRLADRSVVLLGRTRLAFQIPAGREGVRPPGALSPLEADFVSGPDAIRPAPPSPAPPPGEPAPAERPDERTAERPQRGLSAPVTPVAAASAGAAKPPRAGSAVRNVDEAQVARRRLGLAIFGGAALLIAVVGLTVALILVRSH